LGIAFVGCVLLAMFQLPGHAQGKEGPMKHPTVYRAIQV